MIFDGEQNISSSLEIVEPSNRMTFSSNDSNELELTNQKLLNYSKDQSSLSFNIEEERKNSMIEGSVLSNQPPKRKRKEIFDKYKVPALEQNQTKQILFNISNDNNDNTILKTFDQIFSIKSPRNTSIQQVSPNHINVPISNFSKKSYRENTQNTETNPSLQLSPNKLNSPVQQQFKIVKTPQKNNIELQKVEENKAKYDSPSDLLKSQSFFKTPLDLSKSKQRQRELATKNQKLNLSDLQYRISFIQARDQAQISRDSVDLQQILGAQIFRERDTLRILDTSLNTNNTNVINNIPKPQQQAANNRGSTTTVTMVNNTATINTKIPEQNLQQSRFSDVYQRIDMSQSIANSVVMKDSRFQFFDQNQHFMGGQENIMMKKLNRNSSLKSIGSSQDTLINALGSQRMIEQAQQQKRVPIFIRKAVKLNSTVPNFYHPTVQLNIDKQNENLQLLISSFSSSLRFLQKTLQQIKIKDVKRKQLNQLFSNGINLQKFTTSDWETCMFFQNIQNLKPKQNSMIKQWSTGKVQKALQNYRKIIDGNTGIKINLRDERGIQKYLDIRKKIWDIQKNMIVIAIDMYSHILTFGFQKHYVQFKKVLNENEVIFSQKQIKAKKILLQKIKKLKTKGDQLALSQVGSVVISKLTNQIKFNYSNF